MMALLPLKAVSQESLQFNIGCSSGDCVVQTWERPSSQPSFKIDGADFIKSKDELSFLERTRYVRAMRKFPSAISCLKSTAISEQGADLAQVNWARIQSKYEGELCISRIRNRMPSISEMVTWLKQIGFTIVEVLEDPAVKQGVSFILPIWNTKEPSNPLKYGWARIFSAGGHGLHIKIDSKTNQVLSVKLSQSFL